MSDTLDPLSGRFAPRAPAATREQIRDRIRRAPAPAQESRLWDLLRLVWASLVLLALAAHFALDAASSGPPSSPASGLSSTSLAGFATGQEP